MMGVHPACIFTMLDILYTVYIKCIIILLSLHVSALLGHYQETNIYNHDIKDIPNVIIVYISHLMMAQMGRNM
jgi:uncharacterized protein YneF (UPF0154 family)